MRVVCFVCLKEFSLGSDIVCEVCSWHRCPCCSSCLCSLDVEARRVAIAMFLSYVDLSNEDRSFWLDEARKYNLRREVRRTDDC